MYITFHAQFDETQFPLSPTTSPPQLLLSIYCDASLVSTLQPTMSSSAATPSASVISLPVVPCDLYTDTPSPHQSPPYDQSLISSSTSSPIAEPQTLVPSGHHMVTRSKIGVGLW
ncbi:hypothetical protein Tco_1505825 [Tanacetum coccineum]